MNISQDKKKAPTPPPLPIYFSLYVHFEIPKHLHLKKVRGIKQRLHWQKKA